MNLTVPDVPGGARAEALRDRAIAQLVIQNRMTLVDAVASVTAAIASVDEASQEHRADLLRDEFRRVMGGSS